MRFADLQIPTIKLCKTVDGFGVYDPFSSTTFVAGKPHTTIVYCELQNFTATVDDAGMYHTHLNMQVVLYDGQGKAVHSYHDKNIEDVSANRRSDFFLTRLFVLPNTLPPGDYTLKVTIEEPAANKVQTKSMKITLVPGGSAAKG
jgi:hypothetical protein